MRSRRFLALLVLSAAAEVVGCGGGGGGDAAGVGQPPPVQTGTVTTDLQAKLLAARSANALFAIDNLNSDALLAALGALPIGSPTGVGNGAYGAQCAAGTGLATLTDADGSRTLSAGDSVLLSATACQPDMADPWVLSGNVRVDVASGTGVQSILYDVHTGSARLNITHVGTTLNGGRTITGGYSLDLSKPSDTAPVDQAISIPDLSVSSSDVNLRLLGVKFGVADFALISTASGTFTTTVSGIGDIQLTMAVKTPLSVDSNTSRFRPYAGTLTFTGTNFSMDVEYGLGGVVTVRIDNGKDGTVERTVTTSQNELDTLLTVK